MTSILEVEIEMIDYRFSVITNYSNEIIQLQELLDIFKENNLFYEELDKFNYVSKKICDEIISIKDNELFISKNISERWLDILFESSVDDVFLTEKERQAMIYFMSFIQVEELSVFHFQNLFQVSKNTVLNDIKKLRSFLEESGIELLYSRKKGFYLKGLEVKIRSIAYYLNHYWLNSNDGRRVMYTYIFEYDEALFNRVRFSLRRATKEYQVDIVPARFEEMVYLMCYLLLRIEKYKIKLSNSEVLLLKNLDNHLIGVDLISSFGHVKSDNHESLYFTVLVMTILQGEIEDSSLSFIYQCCEEIIFEMKRVAAIKFSNKQKIIQSLYVHLVPAYFRIRFDLPIVNVLDKEIKMQYTELFELTKIVIKPLEKLLGKTIPESEIGYITILFGGEIMGQKHTRTKDKLKALIVCPSGISSSLIMKSELKEIFPQIDFYQTNSINEFLKNENQDEYDLVFSSIPLQINKKVYVVNPLMSQLEKNLLIVKVQEDFLFPQMLFPTVTELLDMLLPYVEIKPGFTKEDIYHTIQNKMNKKYKRKEDLRPMLSELLIEDTIQITESQTDWKAAIANSAQPLLDNNSITNEYIDAMIKKVNEFGPFINIGKGVALPHARPEEGVNKLGMSLLKVKDPVLLCDDEKHAVNLFICLAAVDNETHLKALASLTKILSDKSKLEALMNAETKLEIINIIKKGEN